MAAHGSVRATGWIVLAVVLGIVAGSLLGTQAAPLGEIGKYFISLIKALAAPLLFFAIVEAIITTDIKWKSAGRLLTIVAINACLAAAIGMGLSNLFQPGSHMTTFGSASKSSLLESVEGKKVEFLSFVDGIIPDSLIEPFATNNILALVLVSLLIGCGIRSYRESGETWVVSVTDLVHGGAKVSERLMLWLVQLTPVAVFGVIAKVFGETGFQSIKGLLAYVGVGALGLTIQVLVVYTVWIRVIAKRSLREFWRAAAPPTLFSFGVNSSLATLPLTLNALEKLKISKENSRLAACVGTNLNNDGILLYEAMAIIFVSQALGIPQSLGAQLSIALLCVVTAIGIAGVPEAGIVSLSLIMATLGMPTEILLTLLSVDWILARLRSVTNVAADMTTAVALDAFEKYQKDSSPVPS